MIQMKLESESVGIALTCHLERNKRTFGNDDAGLEIRGILVANATMFSHLLPGFSSGSKHLLLP